MQSDKTISKGNLDDLSAFATVARICSFTRAAAELKMSTSMLSYTIKRLEARLGMSLLQRTSRSVAPTEAGEKLLLALLPALDTIEGTLNELALAEKHVTGTLRLNVTRQAYNNVIRPLTGKFCAMYPQATLEVIIDYGFSDIVAERFDAGIRLGEKLQQDMVAIPAGPPLCMAVVASPGYLKDRPLPATPEDLKTHKCINYRMISANNIYSWEFSKEGRDLRIALNGPLTFNDPDLMLQAALDGLGIAYVLDHEVKDHIAAGRLIRLLEDWTTHFPGFFLYYPSRRRVSPVLSSFISLLKG
ncbi:LysR family transcriptional regulator [Sodalis sp. dw_96]|uniref:LysR family transcriptional regulator n=1 Tax=Sodalis sp. dw_96 TaxID=2719794 RepID=UPI001BD52532|nr:LysR family transcriptional regulator [Sodalis sp. dw_96]